MDTTSVRDPQTDRNLLHYALEAGVLDIADHLIQDGNDDLIISSYLEQYSGLEGKRNIFHILIEHGNKEMIEKVLKKVDYIDQEKLLVDLETVVKIDGQQPKLLPCLHLAAYYGQTIPIIFLLDNDALDIDQRNSKGETALMWASRQGHTETVQGLIRRGADVNIENEKGSTALYWAVRYGYVEVATLLINKGKARPQTKRKFGLVSPLIVSCAYGNVDMVDLMLSQRSIDMNLRIPGGETAMHFAAREGYAVIVSKLIEKGAVVDIADDFGNTPLLLAVKHGHIDLKVTIFGNMQSTEMTMRCLKPF